MTQCNICHGNIALLFKISCKNKHHLDVYEYGNLGIILKKKICLKKIIDAHEVEPQTYCIINVSSMQQKLTTISKLGSNSQLWVSNLESEIEIEKGQHRF